LLAKVVTDDAGLLNACGALTFFASKLAPTETVRRPYRAVTSPLWTLHDRSSVAPLANRL